EQIVRAQADGDRDVAEIAARAVTALGVAAANMCNFVCPELVFVEGKLFRCEENRAALMETVRGNMYGVLWERTRFEFVEPDTLSGARGAAAMAISRDLETYIT
ncbi:MAG: hypothetical protein NC319_08410, partial [Butyricicoccus sp.]|nr:hypothetical protein [Butyricicoccus sp.]